MAIDETDALDPRYRLMSSLRDLIWKSKKSTGPSVPDGHRVYAIGDVHGRDDLLGDLLNQIEADNDDRPRARTHIVFLGDLIDRGPASKQVIERLSCYAPSGMTPVFLAGNHEEVLLRLLSGEHGFVESWLKFGGAQCLRSYGVDPAPMLHMPSKRAAAIIATAIPTAHAEFLRNFADTFRIGDYLFVHAGIRPGVALDDQVQADLRWIRKPFLDTIDDHGFVVVHGHTIKDRIDLRHNRIGIDTGAYRSGVLTAIGAEGSEQWFLQTGVI